MTAAAWVQAGAAVLTFIASALTFWVYWQIRDVMKKTNEISERSVAELRRSRDQEFSPLIHIIVTVGQPVPKDGQRRVRAHVSNFGQGPALYLLCLEDASSLAGLTALESCGSEHSRQDFVLSPIGATADRPDVHVRYQDILGEKWETSLCAGRLLTRRLPASETW